MTDRQSSRSRSGNAPVGLFVIGIGLLLIGLLSVLVFSRRDEAAPVQGSVIPVPVDYAAPSLALTDVSGREVRLEDYRGQVVLVNLWATWCPPCKAEMPTLQAYFEEHSGEGFALVAINAGDALEDVQAFAGEKALTFDIWFDPGNESSRVFRTMSLPSSYVIDRSGQVRLAWAGEIAGDVLEKYVTPIIQE